MNASFLIRTLDDTHQIGQTLSDYLTPGDTILLHGPVGAGKSELARAIIQTRMAKYDAMEDVPSPTFTLVQTYDLGSDEIWHADLYRLSDPYETWELGLEDAFETAICLVEWPDRLGPSAPENALNLSLSPLDDQNRNMTLEATAAKWKNLFEICSKRLPPADDN